MSEFDDAVADVADGLTALVGVLDERLSAVSALVGPQGADGEDGADGAKGDPGRDGAPGPRGPIGPLGKDGVAGQDGADGKDGVRGLAGKAGPRGSDGPLGAKGDKGLNWRGPFERDIRYQADDAIEFEGSSYVAVAPIRGVPPPGNGWDLLALRGAQGQSGFGSAGGGVALSNAIPLVESGTGAAGTGTKASKDDHVHPVSPGAGGDLSYAHSQAVASAIWTINHNLGKRPAVAVVDSTGRLVIGQVDYPNANVVTVTFSAPFSGAAYLN